MIIAAFLLFSTSLLGAKASPVFVDVQIGTSGPFRFLVDTGAQTNLIDPQLASKLRLKAQYRVELVTAQSNQLVPAAKLKTLRLGNRVLPETEVVFQVVNEARRFDSSVEGVLGLNALMSLDFTLLPLEGRLEETAERPAGEVVPFILLEGRMAVEVRMGTEILTLVLDSGSNHLVLFHLPAAMANVRPVTTTITTIEGARSVVPTCWSSELVVGDRLRIETLPAAIIRANGTQADGLLPVSIFKKVHIDQSRHELILIR